MHHLSQVLTRTLFIRCSKVTGAFQSPNGITLNRYIPCLMVNVVLCWASGTSSTCQYPQRKLRMLNQDEPTMKLRAWQGTRVLESDNVKALIIITEVSTAMSQDVGTDNYVNWTNKEGHDWYPPIPQTLLFFDMSWMRLALVLSGSCVAFSLLAAAFLIMTEAILITEGR